MFVYKFKKEIAGEYGFSVKTLNRKLQRAGLHLERGLLSVVQQKRIYDHLGYPTGVDPAFYIDNDGVEDEE